MDTEVNLWWRRGLLYLTSYGPTHKSPVYWDDMEEVTRYESTFRSTEKDIMFENFRTRHCFSQY